MSFPQNPEITEDGRVVTYLTASLLAQTCVYGKARTSPITSNPNAFYAGANLAFLPYAASIILSVPQKLCTQNHGLIILQKS